MFDGVETAKSNQNERRKMNMNYIEIQLPFSLAFEVTSNAWDISYATFLSVLRSIRF